MANEMPGLLGRKLGMTQVYDDDNELVPVTIVEVEPNAVLQVKTRDGADGYTAVQLGIGTRKKSRATKAEIGHAKKAGIEPKRFVREIRVDDETAAAWAKAGTLKVGDLFKAGQKVDVTGTSKGRGYAGVMKRHHFRGFERTHGTHEYFRHGGSIGTRLTPGHVIKGKKMAGQMGNTRVTIQNLRLVRVDTDRNLLFICGGVPGPNGGLLIVRKAVKG